jgi:hypothetical protein
MYIFLISMAAAEVAVGLALFLLHFGRTRTLDADKMTEGNATYGGGGNATPAAGYRGIGGSGNTTNADRGGT